MELLNNREKDFINDLQGVIGELIKPKTFVSKAPHMFSGYVVENGKIKELTLYNKNLKKLPESIDNLSDIRKLYLGKNELFTVPDSIGDLINLEVLSLNDNKIEKIPDSIGNLHHLKILTLAGNNLTNLPEEIGNLENLEVLYLQDNNFLTLPDSISRLKKINSLYIYNNPQLEISNNQKKTFETWEKKGVQIRYEKKFTISEVPSLIEGADPIFMTDVGTFTYQELMDDPLLKLLAEEYFESKRKKD